MKTILVGAVGVSWLSLFACVGCGSDDSPPPATCSVTAGTGCQNGQVCEDTVGGQPACFAPVTIQGKVVQASDPLKPIEGAHVVARDDNGAAVTSVAVTDANGAYSLTVPAKRDASGAPVSTTYTLRADASGYVPFPSGLRVALPIDVKTAQGSPPVVANAATTIELFALANATGLGTIGGTVGGAAPGGTLVVAQCGTSATTAIADKSGAYTIYNVPAGACTVSGYAAGKGYAAGTANVTAGATSAVDFAVGSATGNTVSGSVQIVNAPGGSVTSVVLAVEGTFNEGLGRGEVPRGLRVGNVSGAFAIPGVPDGRYVVLAAFENDGLVRDPDTSIGGTATLHIAVQGAPIDAGGFKVTEALAVRSPGATGPETVTVPPTFVWEDDSSEDRYIIQVFDTFGTEIWKDEQVPSVSGAGDVSIAYGGTAPLVTGNWYQFRATSVKDNVPISRTEDLLGVFIAK